MRARQGLHAAPLAGASGLATASAAQPFPPGEYVAEGGWGVLKIQPRSAQGQLSELSTIGANAHMCDLGGYIDAQGRSATQDNAGACTVTFTADAQQAITVQATGAACRFHCGMRAEFEDSYLKVAKARTTTAYAHTRKAFQRHYERKQYTQAVTHYHLGQYAQCRRVLQPLADDARHMEQVAGRDSLPPFETETCLPQPEAARTNLRLCRGWPAQ